MLEFLESPLPCHDFTAVDDRGLRYHFNVGDTVAFRNTDDSRSIAQIDWENARLFNTHAGAHMTDREIRFAIAKACGWRQSNLSHQWCHQDNWNMAKNGAYSVWVGAEQLPDYLNDLNAMHEAEELLIVGSHDLEYREALEPLCGQYAVIYHATARQRAEALIKTLEI